MDNQPMLDLLWHVRFRWHLRPRQVDFRYQGWNAGKYQSYSAMPAFVLTSPYRTGITRRLTQDPPNSADFAVHDRSSCPQGQPLRPFRREGKAEKVEYRADAATCNACPLKAQCTPSDQGRQVHRSFHASYLERVKSYQQTGELVLAPTSSVFPIYCCDAPVTKDEFIEDFFNRLVPYGTHSFISRNVRFCDPFSTSFLREACLPKPNLIGKMC